MIKELMLSTLILTTTNNSLDEHVFNYEYLNSYTRIENVSIIDNNEDGLNSVDLVSRTSTSSFNEIFVDVDINNTKTTHIKYSLIFDGFYTYLNDEEDVENILTTIDIVSDKYSNYLNLQPILLKDSEDINEYTLDGTILERENIINQRITFISHDTFIAPSLYSVRMDFTILFQRLTTNPTTTTIRLKHYINTYNANEIFQPVYNVGQQDGYTGGLEDGYEDGYKEGYNKGYNEGYDVSSDELEQAYHNGLTDGYDVGFEEGKIATNPFGGFFDILKNATASMHNFFSIEILPNLTLSTILGIFIALPLFIFFMKLISSK